MGIASLHPSYGLCRAKTSVFDPARRLPGVPSGEVNFRLWSHFGPAERVNKPLTAVPAADAAG